MKTKKEIIVQLFKMLDAMNYSGLLLKGEEKELKQLKKDFSLLTNN